MSTTTNAPPTVSGTLLAKAREDDGLVSFDLLRGATDPDLGHTAALTVTLDDALPEGVTLSAGGTTIADPEGAAVSQSVTINVSGRNDAPGIAGGEGRLILSNAAFRRRLILANLDADDPCEAINVDVGSGPPGDTDTFEVTARARAAVSGSPST